MVSSSRRDSPVSLDTNVISLLTGRHPERAVYQRLLGDREPVITYFVQGEVRARNWRDSDFREIRVLLGRVRFLQALPAAVIDQFVLLKRTSMLLGLRYGTEREDLWMLAQSRNFGLSVITADRNAARVASACDIEVLTALKDIEEDYARDRLRLERLRSR